VFTRTGCWFSRELLARPRYLALDLIRSFGILGRRRG
jgi:hypothetical protein